MPEMPFWEDPRLQEIAGERVPSPENMRRAAELSRARATGPANPAEFLASYARTGGAARPTGLVPASIPPRAPSALVSEIPLEEFDDYESIQASTQPGIQPGDVFDADHGYILHQRSVDGANPDLFQSFLNDVNAELPKNARVLGTVLSKGFDLNNKLGGRLGKVITNAQNLNNTLYDKALNLKTSYQAGDFIPDFISKPFGLKNPLVEPRGIVQEGTKLNPQAINWLQSQPKIALDEYSVPAMGGTVVTDFRPGMDKPVHSLDISFEGPSGYSDPSALKQGISRTQKIIAELESKKASLELGSSAGLSTLSRIEFNKEQLYNLTNKLNMMKNEAQGNPLASEAIRYRLGDAISAAPTNTVITAKPIGGPEGGRARLYKKMSEGALETIPLIRRVDNDRVPSEEEFRLARQGGGMSIDEYNNSRGVQQTIQTTKTGPNTFETWRGKTVNWNPEQLKDPLIRAAFNVNKDVDVSSLRANPTNVFINQRPFDASLPVITTASPQYARGQLFKKGFDATTDVAGSVPLFDPAFRQAVEQGNMGEAARRVGTEYAAGLATAPVVGLGMGVLNQISPRAAMLATGALGAARVANPIAVVSQLGGSAKPTPAAAAAEQAAGKAQLLRAEAARKRGGKWNFPTPFGRVTIPELGLSEAGGLFFR